MDDFSKNLCESDYQSKLVKELLTGFEDTVHMLAFIPEMVFHLLLNQVIQILIQQIMRIKKV